MPLLIPLSEVALADVLWSYWSPIFPDDQISFYTTPGDHLKFSDDFLLELVVKYFS